MCTWVHGYDGSSNLLIMINFCHMIRGLEVFRGFLSVVDRHTVYCAAHALSLAAGSAVPYAGPSRTSTSHNVNSRETFKSLALEVEGGRIANCEHFRSYGEGHTLTYFRGELPILGMPNLLDRLAALSSVQQELLRSRRRAGRPSATDAPVRWKLTLNRYVGDGGTRPGFPWHRDLNSNGAASLILNLGADGILQFGPEPDGTIDNGLRYTSDHTVAPGATVPVLERARLTDGDLLVLTQEARWDYLHRVIPSTSGEERITLVYGAW